VARHQPQPVIDLQHPCRVIDHTMFVRAFHMTLFR